MSLKQLDNLDPEFNGIEGLDPAGIAPEDFSGSLARDTAHGAGDFVAESFSDQVNLNLNPVSTRTGKELVFGWNLFSWPWPYDLNVVQAWELVLGYVTEDETQFIIMKDNFGQVYLPKWGFNGIGFMKPGQGYQIKVSSPSTSNLIGPLNFPYVAPADRNQTSGVAGIGVSNNFGDPTDRIPTNQTDIRDRGHLIELLNSIEFELAAGWNIIGTLRLESFDALTAFENSAIGNIETDLILAKDYLGRALINFSVFGTPGFFNGIGDLNPGDGYQVKVQDTISNFKFQESTIDTRPLIDQ